MECGKGRSLLSISDYWKKTKPLQCIVLAESLLRRLSHTAFYLGNKLRTLLAWSPLLIHPSVFPTGPERRLLERLRKLPCPSQAEQCLQHLTIEISCRWLEQKTTLLKLPCSNQAPCWLVSPVIDPEGSAPSSVVHPFSSLCPGFWPVEQWCRVSVKSSITSAEVLSSRVQPDAVVKDWQSRSTTVYQRWTCSGITFRSDRNLTATCSAPTSNFWTGR